MRDVLIHSDKSHLADTLIRGEAPPPGVRLTQTNESGVLLIRVNLRVLSGTAFAMWILRKLRFIPGNHRIEIGGTAMPLHMPAAIDLIAESLVNSEKPLPTAA